MARDEDLRQDLEPVARAGGKPERRHRDTGNRRLPEDPERLREKETAARAWAVFTVSSQALKSTRAVGRYYLKHHRQI